MAYFVIEDFKQGLDSSRLPEATSAGALLEIKNAHINRGGELEKSKALVLKYALPAGNTFGLASLAGELYTFGTVGAPVVPAGVNYQQLAHESGLEMTEILNWQVFGKKLAVSAEYSDGSRRVFYDGVLIPGFTAGSGTVFEGLEISPAMLTYKNKLYMTSAVDLLFSKSGAANIFNEAETGSGLVDMSSYVPDEAELIGLAVYQNYLAIFSTQNVSIWTVAADPGDYNFQQSLPNLSTVAARSIQAFGDHDVFHLTTTGVRSLRAINASLSAGVSDVGTPIDDLIITHMGSLSPVVVRQAAAIIEPQNGRYLLALDTRIYVFTFFQTKKISAWSTWEPGVRVTDWVRQGERLYARAGDNVYLLGGDDNATYTEEEVVIVTAYLDGRRLADFKNWTGMDIVCRGRWDVYVNTNPAEPEVYDRIGTFAESTLDMPASGMDEYGKVMKFKFVHQGEGPAILSKVIIHYEQERQKLGN